LQSLFLGCVFGLVLGLGAVLLLVFEVVVNPVLLVVVVVVLMSGVLGEKGSLFLMVVIGVNGFALGCRNGGDDGFVDGVLLGKVEGVTLGVTDGGDCGV
jgi:hypothetical protein